MEDVLDEGFDERALTAEMTLHCEGGTDAEELETALQKEYKIQVAVVVLRLRKVCWGRSSP